MRATRAANAVLATRARAHIPPIPPAAGAAAGAGVGVGVGAAALPIPLGGGPLGGGPLGGGVPPSLSTGVVTGGPEGGGGVLPSSLSDGAVAPPALLSFGFGSSSSM